MVNESDDRLWPDGPPAYRPPWQRQTPPAGDPLEETASAPAKDDAAPSGGGDLSPARGPGLGWLAALCLVSALAGGIAGGATVAYLGDDGDISADPADRANPGAASTRIELTGAVVEAAAAARPGVVRIESTRTTSAGKEQDVGSGVILDTSGHVVTNAHVVLGTDSLRVILADGTERPAVLVGHDFPFNDVAVLQIGPLNLTPLPVGDSGALKLGETVLAIGNPLGKFDGSVSVGVVSGLDRSETFDGVRQRDLIQTDAALNNGNSGGALVNLSGQFIGMPTAVLRHSGSGQPVSGIAFALPAARVLEIANEIIATGASIERPALGVEHIDLTPETLGRLPRLAVSDGAAVASVAPGGPAAEAGIRPGDVIVQVGDTVIDQETPLFNALLERKVGETVRVVLNRNARIIDVEVRLAKRS